MPTLLPAAAGLLLGWPFTLQAADVQPVTHEVQARQHPALRRSDVQVNERSHSSVQFFPHERPLVHATDAEPAIAAGRGGTLMTVFDSSDALVGAAAGNGMSIDRSLRVAYAVSGNGGLSWRRQAMPPLPGSRRTLGSATAAADRNGRFHASSLALDAAGALVLSYNRSSADGRSFSQAVAIDGDGRVDKPRIAVGRDPAVARRDNVYITWTRFDDAAGSSVLRLARSIDGGATFTTSTIFAPLPDPVPAHPQNVIQFSTPTVDPASGRLYVAMLQFGSVAQDYLRVLASDDGGASFRSLPIGAAAPNGSPNAEVLPVVQPGTFSECGAQRVVRADGQVRFVAQQMLVLHSGSDVGGSLSGLPRFPFSSRLILQPAIAAAGGKLHLVWSGFTGAVFGDRTSGAQVLHMRSDDGGEHWTPPQRVSPAGGPTERHVRPAIVLGSGKSAAGDVAISYISQGADGLLRANLSLSRDGGRRFPASRIRALSNTRFALAPTNTPLPSTHNPYATTHYNRLRAPCFSLGDYAGLARSGHTLHAVWADGRHRMRQPDSPHDPIAGVWHAQEDVFYTQRAMSHSSNTAPARLHRILDVKTARAVTAFPARRPKGSRRPSTNRQKLR